MRRPILDWLRGWLVAGVAFSGIAAAHASQASVPGTVELSPEPLDRAQAAPALALLALNGNVLVQGSLAFMGGYDPADWSGVLQAMPLDASGTPTTVLWDAGAMLSDPARTAPSSRTILSARKDVTGIVAGIAFEPAADFDAEQRRALAWPVLQPAVDALAARVQYLRGVRTHELDASMRVRHRLLGGIVHAQALYVAQPSANQRDAWPTRIHAVTIPAPEMAPGAQRYAQFVADHAGRAPMLYVAANDGMLHAFHAPVPVCTAQAASGACAAYDAGAHAGKEQWAFVPRAAYGNLANLTQAGPFRFQPTVDATPVMRDVFFSAHGHQEWHTLLAGGLRLGGRGVYALDITTPVAASEAFPERTVLWEFDADMAPGLSEAGDAYDPADLGYTYAQPAIARLANGRWAVLVPGGYFPDCATPDKPARCEEAAAAPPRYSALFVLDAQTGSVIAELKTPQTIAGVNSYGLATPVLGDYDNDQVDDVAFAGDLVGNLWRFDLSAPTPADWKVTLAYRPADPGTQPITSMPRLFGDPVTQRFIVVFGTGKYLGVADKSDATVQAIYGIRDKLDAAGRPATVTRAELQVQSLHESSGADGEQAGSARLRSISEQPLPAAAGGWRIDLDVTAGERVVVPPTALFDTGTALISTLIPHGDHPQGAVMALDASTGGARAVFHAGNRAYAGARVENPPATGPLPVLQRMGGGKLLSPGVSVPGASPSAPRQPLSLDSPLWRRRSWALLTPDV